MPVKAKSGIIKATVVVLQADCSPEVELNSSPF
jgi:hypothetical protein